MTPKSEIGSENWVKAQIAAKLGTDEIDKCECADGGHSDPDRLRRCLCGGRIDR